jgi:NhaA family Na+:H+ antiporter
LRVFAGTPGTTVQLKIEEAARDCYLFPPVRRLFLPIEQFLRIEASSGIVLLAATTAALLWANSPWRGAYEALWHTHLPQVAGSWLSGKTLHFWINEGLMTIFFLIVGLEIRREMREGALSNPRQAALPGIAALGGVLVPAIIYFAINHDDATLRRGWAVPTATDIAFAVGVLALLGRRVHPSLRVLLLALAIIDDIAAIVIIALFYSSGVSLLGLVVSAVGVAGVLALKRFGVRSGWGYLVPGVVVWAGMLQAGVHPAIAGVVVGMLVAAPQLEASLHPWVAYGIMPLFAFANAGVSLAGLSLDQPWSMGILAGVAAGLVLGKPVGIVLATFMGVKLGICRLPVGVSYREIAVLGLLGGIGFTMAIFIANLAFADEGMLAVAKLGVLIASVVAAVSGLLVARFALRPAPAITTPAN